MTFVVEAPLIHIVLAFTAGFVAGASVPVTCLWLLETYLKRKGQ